MTFFGKFIIFVTTFLLIARSMESSTYMFRRASAAFRLLNKTVYEPNAGFEINARPLARGDWKPRGMSRIFAQVVRRASEYFNLFCQLGMTMNETNY